MKRFFALTILTAAMAATSAFGATITTYYNTSQTAFNTAFGAATSTIPSGTTTTESFGTNSTSLFTISFNNTTAPTNPATQPRAIQGFAVWDQINNSNLNTVITVNSGTPIYAVSALWDLTPAGTGGGIIIKVNFVGGGSQNVSQVLGSSAADYNAPFWFGFTSDQAIASIQLLGSNLNGTNVETYSFDNLSVVTSNAVIPEPSTFGLMGLALVGLGALRSRRK